MRQFLDRDFIGFVVCQSEVVLGADEVFLDFHEGGNRLVDVFDGGLEFIRSQLVVSGEAIFELIEALLKIRDVDILSFDQLELCAIL